LGLSKHASRRFLPRREVEIGNSGWGVVGKQSGRSGETKRILVVEDERAVASLIKEGLESNQCAVDVAWDGEEAKSLLGGADYNLVVLDLVLPKVDGYQVLNHIRAQRPSLPVLILSGRAAVEDRVKGLDLGADDYLPKPFSYRELSARVRALLRRSIGRGETVLRVEDLELDRAERVAKRAGRHIELTPREFALLECLMRNAGRFMTRDTLIQQVWASSPDTMTNVVDVYVNYLRHKVDQGFEKKLIRTVRGVGYQLGGREKPDAAA